MRILTILLAAGLVIGPASAPSVDASESIPYPLGSVSTGSAPDACPKQGYTCSGLIIDCPGLREKAHAYLATGEPTAPLKGAVALFSPGTGEETWQRDFRPAKDFIKQIRAQGFRVIQVWWEKSWLASASGEQVGAPKLACRPASVIRWLHDHTSVPSAPDRRCGFCVSGGSAGASEIAYALVRYGIESKVDLAVLTSGPPHANLAGSCGGGDPAAVGANAGRKIMDMSYGFLNGGGPCETKDLSWVPRWNADAVDATGDFVYPHTAIRFIFSDTDPVAIYHGRRYSDRLIDAGSPDVKVAVVHNMPHNVENSEAGLNVMRIALTGSGTFPNTVSTPLPGATTSPQPRPTGSDGKPRRTKSPKPNAGGTDHGVAQRPGDAGSSGVWFIIAVLAACAAAGGTYFLRRRRGGTEPPPTAL